MADERLRFAVAVNARAGAALARSTAEITETICAALAGRGEVVAVVSPEGNDMFDALREAARRDNVDVLAVAGGDGTISAAAAIAFHSGKRLLPLPCGTFNLFCRALGFPPDLMASLGLVDRLVPDDVDVATVNGEVFVHHLSVGLHPRFVAIRDAVPFRSLAHKAVATLRAALRTLKSIRRTPMVVSVGSQRWRRRLAGIAVTVNPIAEAPVSPPIPEDPKLGTLAVYMTGARGPVEVVWIILRALVGSWKASRLVEMTRGPEVRIVTRRDSLRVSLDGERRTLETPLDIRLEPRALKVLRPLPESQPGEDGAPAVSSSSLSIG